MMVYLQKNQNGEQGFTLVELAISIVIVGLLVAGVLKGQSLINNARVATTIAKVTAFEAASTNFYGMYDEYPGDMIYADSKIPECARLNCTYGGTIAAPSRDGNSNGRIEGITDMAIADDSNEGRGFWEHLAAADLLAETQIAPGTVNGWDLTHPSSPFGGGFTVAYNPTFNGNAIGRGSFFRLSRNQLGVGGDATSLLTPGLALSLDQKTDDGNPSTGHVLAIGGANCFGGANYNVAMDGPNCDLLFKFK